MRQESHRVYLQTFAPRSAASVGAGYPPALGGGGVGVGVGGGGATTATTPAAGTGAAGGGISSSLPSSAASSHSSVASGTRPPHAQHQHGGARPVHTASAAIRLTDGAAARDVTKLLRAKFGWPPLLPPPEPPAAPAPVAKPLSLPAKKQQQQEGGGSGGGGGNPALDRISARLAEFRAADEEKAQDGEAGGDGGGENDDDDDDGGPPIRTIAVAASPPQSVVESSSSDGARHGKKSSSREGMGEFDALVLVGTVTGLPRNYVRFEHEPEEDDGVVVGRMVGSGAGTLTGENEVSNLATEAGRGAGEEDTFPDSSEIMEIHEGVPRGRRFGSSRSIASITTVKARGGRETSDGSTVDFSMSTRSDPMVGLDLSKSGGGPTVAAVSQLDTSTYRPGPDRPPAASTSSAAAALSSSHGPKPRTIEETPPQPSTTPSIQNGPQSGHHRRLSSGDQGLSASRRNGEPLSSPSSTWAESLIGVPRGGVGTVMTEGSHGHDVGAGGANADAVAADSRGMVPTGYAQGLDRPGPVHHPPRGGSGRQQQQYRADPQRGVAPRSQQPPPQRHSQHRRQHSLGQSRGRHRPLEDEYAVSSEPYNVVRTLLPHESPLAVRDEVARILGERQRRAEDECGVPPRRGKRRAPAFRWFFQPCAGCDGRGRIRTVPSCVDVEGYCSGTESDDEEEDGGGGDGGEDGGGGGDADERAHASKDAAGEGGRSEDEREEIFPYWRTEIPDRYSSHHRYTCSRVDDDLAVPSSRHLETGPTPPPRRRPTSSLASRLADERHRLTILSQREGGGGPSTGGGGGGDGGQCVSGYLLKRSRTDPNVWRRVHCVLTDDQLWYVTRVRPLDDERHRLDDDKNRVEVGGTAATRYPPPRRKPKRIGTHRVVRLTRSLLVASDPGAGRDSSPLSRTPHAFEICTARGDDHVFRATRRSVQRRWVECLSSRIVRAHEDDVIGLADLLVEEETGARGRRMEELAAKPMLEGAVAAWAPHGRDGEVHQEGGEYCGTERDRCPAASREVLLNAVRFGAEVAEYRELCRRARASCESLSARGGRRHRRGEEKTEKAERRRHQDLALAAWEAAEDVLSKSHLMVRAASVSSARGPGGGGKQTRKDRQDAGDAVSAEGEAQAFLDLESIQKQVSEIIEEGRVRILVEGVDAAVPASDGSPANDDAQMGDNTAGGVVPPMELFDALLSILQRISCSHHA